MGTGHYGRKANANSKLKKYKRGHDMKRRGRDLDQVHDDKKKIEEGKPMSFKFDDDLPGGGQFYVWETGHHFINQDAVDKHKKCRMYRRRLRELKEEQYTQTEAEAGAGKTKEVLPPAHPHLQKKKQMEVQDENL